MLLKGNTIIKVIKVLKLGMEMHPFLTATRDVIYVPNQRPRRNMVCSEKQMILNDLA